MPYILYELWKFIAPGLYPKEKKFVLPFVFFGTAFFAGGAAFGFYVFLPITFQFLLKVLPAEVNAQFTVERYFSLVTQMILAMGIIFELPLVLAILSLAGIVKTAMLKKYRRYAIIVAFIVSAIVTPTVDPYTQTLMALPLILFYEFGIWFAWITEKRRGRSAAEIIDPPHA